MAIMKMSEFELLVLNEDVDSLLEKLQGYGNVSFRALEEKNLGIFTKEDRDYDFQRNQFLLDRLRAVLSSLEKLEKKIKKKERRLSSLGIKKMTFNELEERCQHIEIESLLDTYDQFYDMATKTVDGYACFKPWNQSIVDVGMLQDFEKQPIIGTIAKDEVASFSGGLKKTKEVVFWTKSLSDEEDLFVLFYTTKVKGQVTILSEKSHMQKRSGAALGISEDIDEMKEQLTQLSAKQEDMETRLHNIGHYQEEFQMYYEYLQNEALRFETKEKFLQSPYVTKIAGWFFTDETEKFTNLVAHVTDGHYYMEIEAAPLDSAEVPIQLKNNRFFKAFEGITRMYSLPRYNELDPTPLFTFFYAIFFGMMLGDVGYGLLMGISSFAAIKFLDLKESTENFLRFLLYLSVPTIIIGWLYGSFFGGVVPLKGLIDINKDFMFVLIFALCFGIFHLFVGLGIKAYLLITRDRPIYALFDVGFWYVTLIGAIVLISQMFTPLLAAYTQAGKIMLIIGMIGIVLTNGREARTVPGKAASGLYSLYGLTGYIGDVLSYSRLMALGLAGASIGSAFNMIVEMLSSAGFFGIIAGAIVFMIGHSFNIGISGLSAYVHSARLTYVEFFGKFYTGGGKGFEDFRRKSKYIQITQEDER